MELFLCVLGMVLIVEGMPYFVFPDKMKAVMLFVQEQDDATLRIMGAIVMSLGLFIVFVATKGLSGQ